MKELQPSSWIVTMDVVSDSNRPSNTVRYGILSYSRDTALALAGARLARKLRGYTITSAVIELEKDLAKRKGRTITQKKK